MIGICMLLFIFLFEVFFVGKELACQEIFKEEITFIGITYKNLAITIICNFGGFAFFFNILSVVPFIKLIVDKIQNTEEEKIIEIMDYKDCHELLGFSDRKKFMVDTFAKRKSLECIIKDQDKMKYRFFWDERFGDENATTFSTQKTRIKYFKHSKIIFFCEDVPAESEEQPQKPQKKNINTKKGKKKK